MDDDTRKIMTVIAAFDAEHARLHEAIQGLQGSADRLALMIRQAAQSAVEDALKGLHPQIERAGQTLQGLQRFSLWRASLQHLAVAVVAMAIALLGVWWYVPSQGDIAARRAERDELQASIDDLTKRGAKMKTIGCGPKSRLCVLVDRAAGTFGVAGNKDDVYMIVKGY